MPQEFAAQLQTGLLVTERDWIDFISYSNGLPMAVIRVWPDEKIHEAILEAASKAEEDIAAKIDAWHAALKSDARLIPTERKDHSGEIVI